MKDTQLNRFCCYNLFTSATTIIITILGIFLQITTKCNGHGRLIEPPSRASAWRYGFNTPPDYNDHELYCGGFTRQWSRNNGKCGECGDPWDVPSPRPHEHGGAWGLGVIVRKYKPNSIMIVRIELTASHMGYFEFRLCPKPKATQECFDRHLLKILNGTPSHPQPEDLDTRFYPRNGSTIYSIKTLLPDIKCNQCVLQWRYRAGNNWGKCSNGSEGLGCGPQEEFRSCSDIAIGSVPITVTTSTTTTESSTSIDSDTIDNTNFILWLFIFILFLGLCTYIGWYIKHNAALQLKCKTLLKNIFCGRRNIKANSSTITQPTQIMIPTKIYVYPESIKENHKDNNNLDNKPLPPPRTKRHKTLKDLTSKESCVS